MFQLISVFDGRGISCEIAHRLMSLDLTDESILAQQMVWWHLEQTFTWANIELSWVGTPSMIMW